MNVQEQIKKYITSQPEPKRSDMQALHHIILQIMPACKLWFLDGKNSENKTLFTGLSAGGKIEMPIADGPLSSYFGMFADKFGVQWMVDFTPKNNGQK